MKGLNMEEDMLVLVRIIFIALVLMTWLHVGDASGKFQNHDPSNSGHGTHLLHQGKHQSTRNRYLEHQMSLPGVAIDGICKSIVIPNGYPCEEYTVVTDDGFQLAVQQISYGSGGAPVFFQHGLMGGGESFLLNGPDESYPYILADLGYDVWIGNLRCVDWSHGHVNLTSTDPAYWDWSWDEMAKYDVPAMLKFVYSKNPKKVFYIGHSMGTTILMAALISQATELEDIVRGVVLICPVALVNHISNFYRVVAGLYLDAVLPLFGPTKFVTDCPIVNELIAEVCAAPTIDCLGLLPNITGNPCCVDPARIATYLKYMPQPSSSRTVAHFAQVMERRTFAKYDFGFFKNLVRYNQVAPPSYLLSQFPGSVPLLMVSGFRDPVSNPEDVAYLTQHLSQSVQGSIILPHYSHVDFIMSRTANVDFWAKVTTWFDSLIAL